MFSSILKKSTLLYPKVVVAKQVSCSTAPLVCHFAVEPAVRPTRKDYKYVSPYKYGLTDGDLSQYPPEYKQIFGLETMNQAEINQLNIQENIKKFQRHPLDTGSPEVQIAIITERVKRMTQHLAEHKHDTSVKNGMQKLLGKRKRFLLYLRRTNFERYLFTIRELQLNDLGPSLPVPTYRLKDHLKGLELRFRNPNLRPDAQQFKLQKELEAKQKLE
ncbi:hypothetical protein WA158_004780 [Blastocystis sp. Blastoise]